MKVLQVNCVYRKGSTGKIVYDIHTELEKRGIESVVCYGRGEMLREPNVYKTCPEWYSKLNNLFSRFTGLMYGGCFFSTAKLIRIIKKEKPEIVHLHCINGYFVNIYRLVTWLKKHRIKTVLTLHAEFMHTANCGYAYECERWKTGCGNCPRLRQETKSRFFDRTHASWVKMKKAFFGFEDDLIVVSVSPWLMERASSAPILAGKRHITVLNGLDTSIFSFKVNKIKEELGILNKKMVLHVTPSFVLEQGHVKGGYYVVELAKKMPNIIFVVIGSREKYADLPSNIMNIGRVENQEKLAQFYSAADVVLLTSRRETFSMVTAESLSCGTPVVGFEAGAPETIALPEYSMFVPYGDLDRLLASTEGFLEKSFSKDEISRVARAAYAKESMTEGYMAVYEKLLRGNEERNNAVE